MRHCSSCKYRHMDIKALQRCRVVVDKCKLTGNLALTPFFEGFMCKHYKKEDRSPPDHRRALTDGLLILLAAIILLVVFCAAWSHYDRLGWVRFVLALPCPGWLRAWLLGWN